MRTFSRIENGSIAEHGLTEGEIRGRFPNTSFCIPFVPPDGYEEEIENPSRPVAGPLENLVILPPVRVDGALVRQYRVDPASLEQVEQRTAVQASLVRLQRSERLAQTDWTQLPDSPVDPEPWATYRQELRDVPEQDGFPWQVQWPLIPA